VKFSSNLSDIYTQWGAQTFPPIFGVFAIFDRNFAKIVAPPSNKIRTIKRFWNCNHFWKRVKTESKSTH